MSRMPPVKHCLGISLAILAVFLMFSSSSSAQNDELRRASNLAVAGANRPAEVPQGFVITPFGYFHPSCALQLAGGETLLADGGVELGDGAVESAPVCSYPHYTASGLMVAAHAKTARGIDLPEVNGWLESINVKTNQSYGKISATWVVPPLPPVNDGQTLFFFPGLEDRTNVQSILQPVLQWYAPGPWAVASWNCCLQGVVWESTPVNVSPGDTILGTISPTCPPGQNYCAKWNIVSMDLTTGGKTILAKTPSQGQVWNWGFGAVIEVYGVGTCSDYPANASVTFTVQLYDQNLKLIASPRWVPSPAGSNTTPKCNYGLTVTPTKETVLY